MKIFNTFSSLVLSSRFPLARWAPIPIRLIVGYGFMEHGFAKLSRGVGAFAAILQAMGVPHPHFMAQLTILTELVGGFAVMLGAFVAIVSLPMAAVLLVAMFTVHLPYGFSAIKLIGVTAAGAQFGPPGFEVDLLYIACLAALVMGGSGPFAVDRLIGERPLPIGESKSRIDRTPGRPPESVLSFAPFTFSASSRKDNLLKLHS
jgi:putative oxidoreductase